MLAYLWEKFGKSFRLNQEKSNTKWIEHYIFFKCESSIHYTICMFGFAVMRIDFKWIDSIELNLNKSELNVKWFMFEYIYIKVDLAINLTLKSIIEAKRYKL
jgi:hypothetical protein